MELLPYEQETIIRWDESSYEVEIYHRLPAGGAEVDQRGA